MIQPAPIHPPVQSINILLILANNLPIEREAVDTHIASLQAQLIAAEQYAYKLERLAEVLTAKPATALNIDPRLTNYGAF